MLKFNNIKISTKMFIVLLLPTIGLIGISILSIFSIGSMSENLVDKLYLQASQSIVLITNADRDFYQALVAEKNMQTTSDTEELKAYKDSYLENTKQAADGIENAQKIISANKIDFENYKHVSSNLTLLELFDKFKKDYTDWNSLYDVETNKISNEVEYNGKFDVVRENMNQMEEILDIYGQDLIKQNNKLISNTKYLIIFNLCLFVLVSLLFGIFIILNIKKRTHKVIEFINKTANFDLKYDKSYDKYFDEKDEFGIIISAEGTSRKEFRNIITNVMEESKKVKYAVDEANINIIELGNQID